ncbi:3-dehydroshikimate deHydratase [Hyphodiscus hymeniophilus]|uniref:3-dehydroshikimate deHydratase n=1 Tax=Hyphodiscus hymeniophilus TaxID=353542 RepID=A0A9P6VNU0_9HELO|nr:3-dehydroshikimate deHydratase [Hyphodiscus hymeniophilus]
MANPSVPHTSLDQIPTSFATVSVGTPSDPLETKLKAISSARFQAIELGFPDLLSFASNHFKKEIDDHDFKSLCEAGREIKKLCKKNKLEIMMLQPFSNFEGWPDGSKERADAFVRAKGWIEIMKAVETDILQVGSSDTPSISKDFNRSASDLRQLADLLSPYGFRLAYEPWCWSTHAPTWKATWEIIKLVDRPNAGLCLDTFQIAGAEWADPTTSSGMIEERSLQQKLEISFAESLEELSRTVPSAKIYLLQISDAYKLSVLMEKDVENEAGDVAVSVQRGIFAGGAGHESGAGDRI